MLSLGLKYVAPWNWSTAHKITMLYLQVCLVVRLKIIVLGNVRSCCWGQLPRGKSKTLLKQTLAKWTRASISSLTLASVEKCLSGRVKYAYA